MVPGAGIEPAQCCHRGILSPLRLPISPPGHLQGGLLERSLYIVTIWVALRSAVYHNATRASARWASRTISLYRNHLGGAALHRLPQRHPSIIRDRRRILTWRRGSESNRRTRSCSPLHNHSATAPVISPLTTFMSIATCHTSCIACI